jgi:hypothetical protein
MEKRRRRMNYADRNQEFIHEPERKYGKRKKTNEKERNSKRQRWKKRRIKEKGKRRRSMDHFGST